MKKQVYMISGLGSDERVFRYLDLGHYDLHYIHWIKPFPKETMAAYACRLALQIKTENPVIIGLSMGGMMAVEIGKFLKTEKIILCSSAKTASELPKSYKRISFLKLHHIIPNSLLLKPNPVLHKLFGVRTGKDKAMLDGILEDTDPEFFKWAIDAIIAWDSKEVPDNVIHIHGDKDRVIPIKNVQADYIIAGGTHSMIFQKPAEISTLIQHIIADF